MYAILSGGALLALCDKPRYVRLNPDSGAYVEAAPEEAIAISVNGDLYNINGGSAIPDAPEAVVREDDVSEYVFHNRARIVENEETTGAAVVQLEEALCEQDAATEERLTAVEEALCELDSAINGGGEN
ncbi:hypothetical protein [uncultured Oscillibacter sp.]|uniref:hypothetical protein n=1 Tax=uncultured Oscillibacter sp. TaxID=876091 RepID=UPI0025D74B32|nr:hypothetical protein [uncultured Oscillibacter sp.]